MCPSQHLKVTFPPPNLPRHFGHSVRIPRCASRRLLWLSILRIAGVIHPPPHPHVNASHASKRLIYDSTALPPLFSLTASGNKTSASIASFTRSVANETAEIKGDCLTLYSSFHYYYYPYTHRQAHAHNGRLFPLQPLAFSNRGLLQRCVPA